MSIDLDLAGEPQQSGKVFTTSSGNPLTGVQLYDALGLQLQRDQLHSADGISCTRAVRLRAPGYGLP
jgi:hypothetical protein